VSIQFLPSVKSVRSKSRAQSGQVASDSSTFCHVAPSEAENPAGAGLSFRHGAEWLLLEGQQESLLRNLISGAELEGKVIEIYRSPLVW